MAYKLGPTHKKEKREMPALLESRSAKESSPNKFQGSGFFTNLTCVNLVCIFQWPRLRSLHCCIVVHFTLHLTLIRLNVFNFFLPISRDFFVNCFCYNCVNKTILKYDWFLTAHNYFKA